MASTIRRLKRSVQKVAKAGGLSSEGSLTRRRPSSPNLPPRRRSSGRQHRRRPSDTDGFQGGKGDLSERFFTPLRSAPQAPVRVRTGKLQYFEPPWFAEARLVGRTMVRRVPNNATIRVSTLGRAVTASASVSQSALSPQGSWAVVW